MHAAIIFPHQLFTQHPAVKEAVPVFLVEVDLFFNQYNFHKQKLILHRASMKAYEDFLRQVPVEVNYIAAGGPLSDVRKLIPQLATDGFRHLHVADVADNWLLKRLQTACDTHNITLQVSPSPNFLNKPVDLADYFNKKKTYFQTDFYIAQRKQRKLLLEGNEQPLGGKWTYDTENRLKFPKKEKAPVMSFPPDNKYVKEALQYVQINFPDNYGSIEKFRYPVNFIDAEKWLDDFLVNRFSKFGIYEDAMVAKEHFLHHAVLTPMLNIGLLSPQQIIDKALDAAVDYAIPLNSLEGFLRQIVGWREFIRIVYEREGSKQRTKNYWGFTRKIPASFWTGETGIAPIDIVIKKILKTGYSHHIERLMVLGNFMLLCEFDPDEVYRWFMEMYADSYDWVMVPNVYGMTQFADGGLMTTKPYISGSNYLMKMSDFEKGSWQQVWDGLFWRFMHVHRTFFLKNPRLGMLVNTFDKMTAEKQRLHLGNAEKYLIVLDEQNGRNVG
ncbi:MAG: cryptochrome/photolyase family protein [Chitinophagaceae bacterium]